MRLVLDLQACQTGGSRNRGIGRYSLALATAMMRRSGDHEVWVALNKAFPETAHELVAKLSAWVPRDRFLVWDTPRPVAYVDGANAWRRGVSEILRETQFSSINPDFVHVSSLFEGLSDEAVVSIGEHELAPPAAVTLYDLIPLIHQNAYLSNPTIREWYLNKLASMRRARLLLAISESSKKEAIQHLHLPADRIINISSAADEIFQPVDVATEVEHRLRHKLGLNRPFVMYTGGIDHRKNIEGLIRAYALLPDALRQEHQLAVVCSVQDADRTRLRELSVSLGLRPDALVMTGYVDDEELVALCNLCKLFVFPSWHEGFGLPALEAMACGAPVIASNTSSLPEVVGCDDALFDPHSAADISKKMFEVLTDAAFRQSLSRHGISQSKRFSWSESARLAIEGMEAEYESRQFKGKSIERRMGRKLRLAFVTPVPPERTGVADYSAELLPALSNHYDIDIVSDQKHVLTPLEAVFPLRTVNWFVENAEAYDRVLYHFGNSPFHQHMFDLLERVPGIVVLHDFYLGHLQRHREFINLTEKAWWRSLFESHGYPALIERRELQGRGEEQLAYKYPCNWGVIRDADGVIVHSEYSVKLIENWYGDAAAQDVAKIPHLRASKKMGVSKCEARKRLGLPQDVMVFATFGVINRAKHILRLIEVWRECNYGDNHFLVLAGGSQDTELCKIINLEIEKVARKGKAKIVMTGYLSPSDYNDYLAASDVAIQLRADSRGETSGAILDCMASGLPVIANAHGATRELPSGAVYFLPDEFADHELARALAELDEKEIVRRALGCAGKDYVRDVLSPSRIASAYREAIERFSERSARRRLREIVHILDNNSEAIRPTPRDLVETASVLGGICPLSGKRRQLLVDVSVLVITDARSGIQRVVRSVLMRLLKLEESGFRIEPVYVDATGTYRYARAFASRFLGLPVIPDEDFAVEAASGDVFLGLDLVAHRVPGMKPFFQELRQRGVSVQFVLYDLLPVLHPEWFPSDLAAHLANWYRAIGEISDRVIAISRSVAAEYRDWLDGTQLDRERPLKLGYFHLGADIQASAPSTGIAKQTQLEIDQLVTGCTFLMVGTVEPRKGHAQALDAFEQLWREGHHVVLAIVGKRGWRVDALAERIALHPELGKRLFWFEGVSDEALEAIYAAADMLLAASFGEGFGLPLVEAARRDLPILARDIPVFREVVGSGADYFEAETGDELARAILQAFRSLGTGQVADPSLVPVIDWEQSTTQLLEAIAGKHSVSTWSPGRRYYYPAGNSRLHSQIAELRGGALVSEGGEGFLVYGPYQRLAAGRYVMRLHGDVIDASRACVDAVCDVGGTELCRIELAEAVGDTGLICQTSLELNHNVNDLEVRLWVDVSARVTFRAIEIVPEALDGEVRSESCEVRRPEESCP